ncbi:hypothetical protein GCM10022376_13670 [Yimella lutea]
MDRSAMPAPRSPARNVRAFSEDRGECFGGTGRGLLDSDPEADAVGSGAHGGRPDDGDSALCLPHEPTLTRDPVRTAGMDTVRKES